MANRKVQWVQGLRSSGAAGLHDDRLPRGQADRNAVGFEEALAFLDTVARDTCWFHGHEPVPEEHYIVCGECGHCYVTGQDLVDTEQQHFPGVPPRHPDNIFSCPLCTHDF